MLTISFSDSVMSHERICSSVAGSLITMLMVNMLHGAPLINEEYIKNVIADHQGTWWAPAVYFMPCSMKDPKEAFSTADCLDDVEMKTVQRVASMDDYNDERDIAVCKKICGWLGRMPGTSIVTARAHVGLMCRCVERRVPPGEYDR
uniref:Uncharacterized protein n=1 Tax=Romanomermis culicivorax TaxID=13658 RepID=A0A915HK01_ROMCU